MNMKVSNRVKRNLALTMSITGCIIIAARGWEVAMAPTSGKAWFELTGIMLLTWLSHDNFRKYNRRVKAGIKFSQR